MLVPGKVDFEAVDPSGRVDVLLYRGAKLLAQHIEQNNNVKGVWDALRPYVSGAIESNISPLPIPSEIQAILSIIQVNSWGL